MVDIKEFFKLVTRPYLMFPIFYLILISCTPDLSNSGQFVLTNVAKWSPLQLSLVNLVFGVLYSGAMIYVINTFKKLGFEMVLLVGGISNALSLFSYYGLHYATELWFPLQFFLQLWLNCFQNLAQDLPLISIIGKFSQYCPEGFESTGVTLLITFSNTATTVSSSIASYELTAFNVTEGHYDNLIWPSLYNHYYAILLIILCPIFSLWKKKEIKKSRRPSKIEAK